MNSVRLGPTLAHELLLQFHSFHPDDPDHNPHIQRWISLFFHLVGVGVVVLVVVSDALLQPIYCSQHIPCSNATLLQSFFDGNFFVKALLFMLFERCAFRTIYGDR